MTCLEGIGLRKRELDEGGEGILLSKDSSKWVQVPAYLEGAPCDRMKTACSRQATGLYAVVSYLKMVYSALKLQLRLPGSLHGRYVILQADSLRACFIKNKTEARDRE